MTTKAEREAAEAKEAAAKAKASQPSSQTTVMPPQTAAQAAHDADVDEANRKAQAAVAEKQAEMTRKENEQVAARDAALSQFAPAGPDPEGKAEGAANYDPPDLGVERGSPEWHMRFPGELTSGTINPREEIAAANKAKSKE